jgi:hypothetical protein
MLERTWLGKTGTLILALVALASTVVFAGSCNTSRQPNQQVKDSQIATEVKTKLASTVRASSLANIQVNTTNGVVTLAGQVENAEVKHSAEKVTAAVPGVGVNDSLQDTPRPSRPHQSARAPHRGPISCRKKSHCRQSQIFFTSMRSFFFFAAAIARSISGCATFRAAACGRK